MFGTFELQGREIIAKPSSAIKLLTQKANHPGKMLQNQYLF